MILIDQDGDCPIIRLDILETEYAHQQCNEFQALIRKRGAKDAHGAKGVISKEDELVGAEAELALALYLGVDWHGCEVGNPNGPDVGVRTQVRSSAKKRNSHNLMIRPRDLQKYGDVPFVLMIKEDLDFQIKGWISSMDAKTEGRWWDGNNGRPPLWFVAEKKLKHISTLKNP